MPTRRSETGGPAPCGDAELVAARREVPRVVAVVSDGSALCGTDPAEDRAIAPDSLAPLLDDDAAGLHIRAGIPAWAAPLRAEHAEDLAAQLCALPADTGAIFLTHTDPARARATQQTVRESGGPPVVTGADTTAIALTAAALTAIARAGRTPAASRVVIAGSATMPNLCPLLRDVGIGDIGEWNAADTHAFPLLHLAHHTTAMIDLIGATAQSTGWSPRDRWSTMIRPNGPGYRLLAAPGLFAALVHYPNATLDVDVFRACVLALVAATPRGRAVPDMDDPHLSEIVESAALRVLAQRTTPSRPDFPHE